MVQARKALDSLWKEEAQLKGRCWGPKGKDNPFSATNITIAIGTELVSISQTDDGQLRIHEFSKTENTSLGERVRKILQEEGLVVED